MVVLIDEKIAQGDAFSPLGELVRFRPTQSLFAHPALSEAKTLIVRSVTRVDGRLLDHAPGLETLCSATAGLDHLDLQACRERGVRVCSAPGHNAEAVADWVWTFLHAFASRQQRPLKGLTLGVVGAGNTGQAVARRAPAYGCEIRLFDPPREAREEGFDSVSEDVLAECDALSLHLPLTVEGESPWPTENWFTREKAEGFRGWLLNASRGEVIHPAAFAVVPKERLALDVYPQEPSVDSRWVSAALFSTPHVAGGTHQAKRRATGALLQQLDLPALPKRERPMVAQRIVLQVSRDGDLLSVEKGVGEILAAGTGLLACCQRWQREMREGLSDGERATIFEDHRREARRESLRGLRVFLDESVGERSLWTSRLEAHGVVFASREDAAICVEAEKVPS